MKIHHISTLYHLQEQNEVIHFYQKIKNSNFPAITSKKSTLEVGK